MNDTLNWLDKIDDSKYFIAGAAIVSSLAKDNLLSELGRCYPDLFKNDIMQLLITASTMFIFVRDARVSIIMAFSLYIFINLTHAFTGRKDCVDESNK